MDSLITAAARALAAGDPLGALKRVSLRDDAPALALRGIAMAQLGDFVRAKALLRKAIRSFGQRETLARARCVVAQAEIALASRDLTWPGKTLDAARATLERHDDRLNAAHARYLEVRRLVLIGRLDEAERKLAALDPAPFPAASRAAHELVVAGIAMRRVRAKAAHAALVQAERSAREAGIPALIAEVESATKILEDARGAPDRARQRKAGCARRCRDVVQIKKLIVDACRHVVRDAGAIIPLAGRPVLFALARALGEAWPGDVSRSALIASAFRARFTDELHRARLRVEIGRLRKKLRAIADVNATEQGFALVPRRGREVVVLARPVEEQHADVLAFLTDGELWSSSALALALGESQRSVQRALDELAASGKVQSFGRARSRRWITPPVPGFATTLLLPAPLPGD